MYNYNIKQCYSYTVYTIHLCYDIDNVNMVLASGVPSRFHEKQENCKIVERV